MNLELRHLKVVVAIAETGSVTKAASVLGMAQPALTAQLQRIERTLGGPLFERDRRGARPTALGELVLARARVVLPAMRGLQDEAARLAGNGTALTRYRIGSVAGPIVGGLVHRLAAELPHAQVSTYASWSAEDLTQMVLGGRLDFALVGVCGEAPPPAERDLLWRALAVDAVCVLLPADHPLAGAEAVRLGDLAEARWVATPGDGCFADCFAQACARAGFTPRKLYETDTSGCMDLVEVGEAVALCQPTFRPVAGLVTRPIAGNPLRWRQLIGWHAGAPAAAAADRICGFAVEAYRDSVRRCPAYLRWLGANPCFGVRGPAGP